MAFTREQIQKEIGGMNNGLLADTIANPSFNADARRFGVEILIDRKAIQANLPIFGVLVKSISDERAAAEVTRVAYIEAAKEDEARYAAGLAKAEAAKTAEAIVEVHPASAD